MDLTETNENFVKIAKMILEVIPKHMRMLFIDKWNLKYPNQPWENNATSGQHLFKLVSQARNQNQVRLNPSLEHIILGGNVEEWDPTALFFVFLYANLKLIDACRPQEQRVEPLNMSENIDRLRDIRNTFFAHPPSMFVPNFREISTDIKGIAKNLFGNNAEDEVEKIANSQIATSLSIQLKAQLENETAMNSMFIEWQREIEEKMEAMEEKMEGVEEKMEGVEEKMEGVEENIEVLVQQMANIQQKSDIFNLPDKIEEIPDDLQHFVGRSEVLEKLKCGFDSNKIVILHGMTGTGKSAIATTFANQQNMQYHNRIWINMKDVSYLRGNTVNELFRFILQKFYINTSEIKETDLGYHLAKTFIKLSSEQKQTLVILDNLEDFLVIKEEGNLSFATKLLFAKVEQAGKNWVHILGTSRCKADEQHFKGAKNIELTPFTFEESKEFLKSYSDRVRECSEYLHKSSHGYPLILEQFSNILRDVGNKRDFMSCLKHIQEEPAKVSVDSQYIKDCLIASLTILNANEMQLAETLSFFGEWVFFDYAENLCKEVDTKISCVHQLEAKGVVKSTSKGYSMHPFLKEILNERVSAEKKRHFKASLVLVYIKALLKLSRDSFQKDKLAPLVAEFQERMSSFSHLINILDSLTFAEKKMFVQEVTMLTQKTTFAELDPCLFFLLLRFLYYLVPKNNIRSIFEFLMESSSQESTKGMLHACLDELDWNLDKKESSSGNLDKYQMVMYERRKLSQRVKDIRNCKSPGPANFKEKTLRRELNDLLKDIEDLSDENIKAYYTLKVNKLLGNLALHRNHPARAVEYFKECCRISEITFGASFWTIDSYDHLAQSQAKDKKSKLAIEAFEKGMEIAQDTGLLSVPVICTLLWSYAKFCLKEQKIASLKERAKDLLNNIVKISYHQNEFNFFAKAYAALCNNFPDLSQDMIRDVDKVGLPAKEFTLMVDEMFDFRLAIIDRSTDGVEIERETRNGIDILKSGIAVLRERLDNDSDRADIENALFNWNRNIALYCPHVLLESERKPFANEALAIPNRDVRREYDRKFLETVRDGKYTDEEQSMIVEVSFLEKTNKRMAACEKDAEQKEKILNALKVCKLSWLTLKLLTCQLELIVIRKDANIELMSTIAELIYVEESVQQRPAFTIYDAIQVMQKRELTNEERRQLKDICSKCIENLKKASLKKGKEKKCSFQICQIDLLRRCGDCDKEYIASLMQEVLESGKKDKLDEVSKVKKHYEKYIKKHKRV